MEPMLSPADQSPPPVHVAIIMDGNGRWAKARGLPRTAGHKRGAEAVRRTVEAARELGVSYLTLYAFSSENWKRPAGEITDLMGLLRLYLRNEVNNLHKNGIRLKVIGDRARLGADIVRLIEDSEAKTAGNTALTLLLALSYGGRQEIVEAARTLARDVAEGRIAADAVDEDAITARLSTSGIPDPDLIIRTSGEQRISNFLLWQGAYAELVFMDTLWPDFGRDELEAAIRVFHGRDRRFGTAR
ncbi:undecaprenyl pyrophosphate synthase [Paramagnetospirillum caucaseum]|uniref:Isoprenyl transferase n=1 Tax=Paramagnetospirillum caucaseum TaxID=1244869 RepID=M3AE43_9PROT|nr:isoprenyl transferase [Paramagnetospirillum caucaseum]EME70809.1 undecaprenyl pyrophosphate synthase [Paramagnetospirillum caucaseum]